MYRTILTVVWIVAVAVISAAGDQDIMKKCMPLMHPKTLSCCTKIRPLMEMEEKDFSDCSGLPMKPTTCEFEVCIGKEMGIIADDGSLDKKSIVEMAEKAFADDPKLAEVIKNECVDADVGKYAPMEFCDVIKFKNCIQVQLLKHCPEFSSEGECSATKALVEECMASFS